LRGKDVNFTEVIQSSPLTVLVWLQVGTGFSFADDAGYARTEDDVAENLIK